MSKEITKENLLSTLPLFLASDKKQLALAIATAEELERLYQNNDLLSIYTKIDSLSEELLDILAYDFKVDWWDRNYSLQEKRETFKGCWKVRKALGTPTAVSTAVSAVYKDVRVIEWWQYGGNPYRFKLLIDTGTTLLDCQKLDDVIDRIRFYKNLRSKVEKIEIETRKEAEIFVGIAIQRGSRKQITIDGVDASEYDWLTDENGDNLLDENGMLLYI